MLVVVLDELINKGDFLEFHFTGREKASGLVFDTTEQEHSTNYSPIRICVGEGNVLAGLDNSLVGKELGRKYTVTISPEEGFGKRNADLIKIMPTSTLIEQDVEPKPGLTINFGGVLGVIKGVTGGRTIIDFNHPLAGKELEYEFTASRKITETAEKIQSLLDMSLRDFDVSLKDSKVTVKTMDNLNSEVKEKLTQQINRLVPDVNEIEFLHEEGRGKKGEAASEEPDEVK
ncbi:hypothetical protein COV22_00660 [Candidatus Woesearchaeota archaeon CG10_big_fil_rev_8_21_14_0_10_47_5]|nr:MAG: hypothetical protein COV22_00660 [Candidatus Woesearchaeota archaeon CG10_big_fil_rev_8_21_14_0_10_47_5]